MNQDVLRMAKEAGITNQAWLEENYSVIERFAYLVQENTYHSMSEYKAGYADGVLAEREACAKLVFHTPPQDEYECELVAIHKAIIARGENV